MNRGGIWWFLVFAGALATAAAVRFAVNGGFRTATTGESIVHSLMAVLGIAGIMIGLLQVVRKSRQADMKNGEADEDLRIT
ncbi:MAG: hypothetical protein IPM50_14840 [Acidobacteriota bacterium]|nr:MAG: hypothetical protein IPM50_14840 [Acidobacteriota bacterium]